MVKVLLVGNGAREHAIARAMIKSGAELYAVMDKANPGIMELAAKYKIVKSLKSFEELQAFNDVNLAIIGPESPLASGIVDFLEERLNIPTVGPDKSNARIESSKVFCRELMQAENIPGLPRFRTCRNEEDVREFLRELGSLEVAVKPDGLTGGKGVKISGEHLLSEDDIVKYALERIALEKQVVVEEKLVGREFTLQAFTDGVHMSLMPLVRDYKRARDGDTGPNTGSMGSYSLPDHGLPYLTAKDIEAAREIMKRTLDALKKVNGKPYKGILYGQFMKTRDGVYLIEFNVRFGDPEAMNVLTLLKTNFVDLSWSIVNGTLRSAEFENLGTVCVYLVPKNYPEQPVSGKPLEIPSSLPQEVELYYASVDLKDGKVVTSRSRALALLSKGIQMNEVRNRVYMAVRQVRGQLDYRTDIALEVVEND